MTSILHQKFELIPNPYLLVCEGFGDVSFIDALLDHRKITNSNVGCPTQAGGYGDGRDSIPSYLKAVRAAMQKGKANLRGILVIVDADSSPEVSFKYAQDSFVDAGFKSPPAPYVVHEENSFRTAVFVVPGKGRSGTLEHLLWDAVSEEKSDLQNCVGAFDHCIGGPIGRAESNAQAKMRLSVVVGAFCHDNPWVSLAWIWSKKGNPIPIDSPLFDELAGLLTTFTS